MKNTALFNDSHSATYCPEDDKLRLYVGRVPREEYEALRAEGWQATPKQDCDFSATWTVNRKNTAESYAGVILDEDASPADRAADRADRFAGYLDKRLSEATGHADRFDAGPSVHGNQSFARAVRSADRHDKHASRAVDAWDKADYWQRRTAGVIASALYKASPAVRMGRIKTIEAEKRQAEKSRAGAASRYAMVQAIAADPGKAVASVMARYGGSPESAALSVVDTFMRPGKVRHPRRPEIVDYTSRLMEPGSADPVTVLDFAEYYLSTHAAPDSPQWENTDTAQFIRHCDLRLAYEMQMLEAQGGRAGMLEMEVGGWLGGKQIRKINKSPATGRVVSVQILDTLRGYRNGKDDTREALVTVNIERLAESSYKAPTEEDKEALAALVKAEKAARPKTSTPSLVNPTMADAQRLQDLFNAVTVARWEREHGHTIENAPAYAARPKTGEVCVVTQAVYSANSKGTYSRAETRGICGGGKVESTQRIESLRNGPVICKVRTTGYEPIRVVHITDKPAKPLPAAVWEAFTPEHTPDSLKSRARELVVALALRSYQRDAAQDALILAGRVAGLCNDSHMTEAGHAWAREIGAYSATA